MLTGSIVNQRHSTADYRVIDDQGASSFAGLSLVDQLASRPCTWSFAQKVLPMRGGRHQRIDILKGEIAGLLSGSRGTAVLEAIRQDEAVLRIMGVKSLPGEKGFWEDLAKLGEEQTLIRRVFESTRCGGSSWHDPGSLAPTGCSPDRRRTGSS